MSLSAKHKSFIYFLCGLFYLIMAIIGLQKILKKSPEVTETNTPTHIRPEELCQEDRYAPWYDCEKGEFLEAEEGSLLELVRERRADEEKAASQTTPNQDDK